jgi:hypothetical protein
VNGNIVVCLLLWREKREVPSFDLVILISSLQTGSGKTYTMGTGFDEYDTASMGLVYRSVEYLFGQLNSRDTSHYSYTMSVSFLELYNEELVDLLNPATRTLKKRNGLAGALSIREDGKGGVVWDGVQEEVVKNADELMGYFTCLRPITFIF